jgi:hypothetical protein
MTEHLPQKRLLHFFHCRLSDGDPRNSSIARVGTPWLVGTRMVNYFIWQHCAQRESKEKKKNDYLLKDEIEDLDNWSRIIVLKVRKA